MKRQLFILLLLSVYGLRAQVWKPVAGGIIGADAVTMCEYKNRLFVSGSLSMLGPNYVIDCDGTAAWNDTAWTATGVTGNGWWVEGRASIIYNNNLYIGCDNGPNEINIFNGTGWTILDIPTNNASVSSFEIYNGNLIVGGKFDSIGGVAAKNIAMWNGTSWAPLAMGVDSDVYALKVYSNELYAAGFFLHAGGQPANYIARWNGTSWSAVGPGFDLNARALAVYNNDLYIGGYFKNAGSVPCYSGLAKWDGVALSGVGSVKDYGSGIHALFEYNSELYVGGGFDSLAGMAAHDVIRYNGSSFSAIGNNLTNSVDCFAEYNGRLYAGGWFCINPNTNCANGRIAVLDTTDFIGINSHNMSSCALYPNPASTLVFVDLPPESVLRMELFNMSGEVTKKVAASSQMNVSDLCEGVYFLEIELKDRLIREKVIITH